MLLLHDPSKEEIERFLASQANATFSYSDVGASNNSPPSTFRVDHNRIQLGRGKEVFDKAREAIGSWKPFDLGWVRLCWPDTPIKPGSTVAILAKSFGLRSLNAARIVYVIEDLAPHVRFGFAYGTLPEHVECGEERFLVEWREDDSVWYDLLAFSRPKHLLIKAGYPLGRMMQRRFVRDSQRAMIRAVEAAGVKRPKN
jgi:uncharacterized protein (UPF0548 family)